MTLDDGDMVMRLLDVNLVEMPGKVFDVTMQTSRGELKGLVHPCEGEPGAVIWVGGASGNANGPAGGLYVNLGQELTGFGITSLRLQYRQPGEINECVLDALGGASFLRGVGAEKIAIVGHSFGGAVAIMAAALNPNIAAVAALSSQNFGTDLVGDIAPRPLLLIHGSADPVCSVEASRDIYGRAGEPKQLMIQPDAGHGLMECQEEVHQILGEWLVARVGNGRVGESTRRQVASGPKALVWPVIATADAALREIVLYEGDITAAAVDAIVCPTNEELWLGEGVAGAIARAGGPEIQWEASQYAPLEIGETAVTRAGRLRARHIIHVALGGSVYSLIGPNEATVAKATRQTLQQAESLGLKSLAFPALGSGVGSVPVEKVAAVMIEIVEEHLRGTGGLEKVVFALMGQGAYQAFAARLSK